MKPPTDPIPPSQVYVQVPADWLFDSRQGGSDGSADSARYDAWLRSRGVRVVGRYDAATDRTRIL